MANKLIAGIDVGSTKIAMAIAVVENNSAPRVIGEASFPSAGVRKGEIIGIEQVQNSIQQTLEAAERMAGLTVTSVIVSVNGKHITSTNNKAAVSTNDNEISTDDMLRAMEHAETIALPNDREIVHLIPREFVVDTASGIKDPIGMTGKRLEVDAHIISATATALHNLRKCMQQLALKIEAEIFTSWAAAQSVLTSTEKELGVILLDIGGGTTSVTIFEEGSPAFSASIPLGGLNITKDLAAGLRLSLEDAERLKLNIEDLMRESKETDDPKKKKDIVDISQLEVEGVKTISYALFKKIVTDRVEETIELVRNTIVEAGMTYNQPAGIVITGGTAQLTGITTIVKDVFGKSARVGTPRGLDGLTDGISSPAYAVLHGLILEGARNDSFRMGRTSSVNTSGIGGAGIWKKITGFFKNLIP